MLYLKLSKLVTSSLRVLLKEQAKWQEWWYQQLKFKDKFSLSFNQDGKSDQQYVQDDKEETQSCFKRKEFRYISLHYTAIKKKDDNPLNTKEQANALWSKMFQSG